MIDYKIKLNPRDLQTVPLSTISAICPKVMNGHQHDKQHEIPKNNTKIQLI